MKHYRGVYATLKPKESGKSKPKPKKGGKK
jgi:hypothetical protein